MTPGLVISAPASRSGKTTLTLGLLAALRARGMAVQPFKCGPDYIDPAFHTAAAGQASINLDSWAMGEDLLRNLASRAQAAELAIAEGAMGLFDGAATPGETGIGASADIAALMGWPVILVLDGSGQAQSAGAVARGFAGHRPSVALAGVIFNNVASDRHEALLRYGMEGTGIPVLGALRLTRDLVLPERHLGLVQAGENLELPEILDRLAALVADHCDLDAITRAASGSVADTAPIALPPPGDRIALAKDAAFSFIYPHLIEGWRRAGATILPFSPLADEAPDPTATTCWLPGGYPELHAGRLAATATFLKGTRAFAQTRPVHGECGGYMTLGAGLEDADGVRHEMLGLLGLETSFAKRKLHLGYRLATLDTEAPGLARSRRLRGHEFHYATVLSQPDAPLARIEDANGADTQETGSYRDTNQGGRATGTFFHMIAEASG